MIENILKTFPMGGKYKKSLSDPCAWMKFKGNVMPFWKAIVKQANLQSVMTENYYFRAYCQPSVELPYPLVETIYLKAGQTWKYTSLENEIIYVHYGKIFFITELSLETGMMLILPSDCTFTARAVTTVSIFLMRVRKDYRLLQGLDKDTQQPLHPTDLQPISIPENVRLLFTLLREEEREGIITWTFMEMKVMELFALLRAYYPKEKLATVFFPFLHKDTSFIVNIWNHSNDVRTVAELARLCCCSRSRFQMKFKETFGVPPYKWITKKKVLRLKYELYSTNKQVAQIAVEQGFSSTSQLSDFCKKNLGHSPEKLRKKYFGIWMRD